MFFVFLYQAAVRIPQCDCMLPLVHNTYGYLSLAVLRSCYSADVRALCSHSLTLLPCSSNRWFLYFWFDLMRRDICKATARVDVPSIPVAVSAAASEHYATAQSSNPTIVASHAIGLPDVSFRLPDEAAVPRLGPVPHPVLLCGHRVNARVHECDICKLLDRRSFVH